MSFFSRDDNKFRDALKDYEAKNYKKVIKTADAILKKNPRHYESYSLRGLAEYYDGTNENGDKKEKESNKEKEAREREAFSYIEKGMQGSSNPVVCHITGLYYRALKDYGSAAKWYNQAIENGTNNKGILRDLSSCLTQVRDYKHLVKARLGYLEDQPVYRANWTATSVAHYLNGQYKQSENVMTKIEGLLKGHIAEDDLFEHGECILFKNRVIYEGRGAEAALENLAEVEPMVLDGAKFLEYRAQYLEELGRPAEASRVYRQLLKRNPGNVAYYQALERTLGTDKTSAKVRLALYEKLAKFYPRADPPQFLPLTFLSGASFAKKAKEYILGQLRRGVPATFVNVKPLYKKKANQAVLFDIVHDFYETESRDNPLTHCWAGYFLAQHLYRVRQLPQALEMIDAVIKETPTLVELYIVKARILKRMDRLQEAAKVMDYARSLDLQDRFVNTKAVKYWLRADEVEKAVDTVSLFTRNEGSSTGVQDLHLMQCVWFLAESGEAYYRLYKKELQRWAGAQRAVDDEETPSHDQMLALEHTKKAVVRYVGLAIKRFLAVVKVFEEYEDDQFDFHHYSMRKGTPRTYVEMLRWEDALYHQPLFLRSAEALVRVYMEVLGTQELFVELLAPPPYNLKRSKKEKKDEIKRREDLLKYSRGYAGDDDVYGEDVLRQFSGASLGKKHTEEERKVQEDAVNAELSKLAGRVDCDSSVDAQYIVFRVNQWLKKYVLCLAALNKVVAVDAASPVAGYMVWQLTDDANSKATQSTIKKILQLGLKKNFDGVTDASVAAKYFAQDDLATGKSVADSVKVGDTGVLGATLKRVMGAVDPYTAGCISYYG